MIIQNERETLLPIMKPDVLGYLESIDSIFDKFDYSDHESEVTQALSHPEATESDKASEIEDVYKVHTKKVLKEIGLVLTNDEDISLQLLAALLDAMEDIADTTNRDLVDKHFSDEELSPEESFINLVNELTNIGMGELYPIIGEFYNEVIMNVKVKFDVELDEDEKEIIHKSRLRTKKALTKMETNDKVLLAREHIKMRPVSFAFGFNFEVAVRAIFKDLEYFIETKDIERVSSELTLLALASNEDQVLIQEKIGELLDDLDVELFFIGNVSGMVGKLLKKWLADDEDN